MKTPNPTDLLCHLKELAYGSEIIFSFEFEPRDFLDELMKFPSSQVHWNFISIDRYGCKIAVIKTPEPNCASLASLDFRINEILDKYGIDHSKKSSLPLSDLAKDALADIIAIKREIYYLTHYQKKTPLPNELNPHDLVLYIIQKHHRFTQDTIRNLYPKLEQIAKENSRQYLALFECFEELADELIIHMQQEEITIFPRLLKITSQLNNVNTPSTEELINTILHLEDDHIHTEKTINRIRKLTCNYRAPRQASPSIIYCFEQLKALDEDIQRHAHLESVVLIEKLFQEITALTA